MFVNGRDRGLHSGGGSVLPRPWPQQDGHCPASHPSAAFSLAGIRVTWELSKNVVLPDPLARILGCSKALAISQQPQGSEMCVAWDMRAEVCVSSWDNA